MSSLFFGALDRGTEKRSSKTGFYSRVLPPPLLVERPTDIPVAENPKNQNNNNKHSLRTNANAAAGC